MCTLRPLCVRIVGNAPGVMLKGSNRTSPGRGGPRLDASTTTSDRWARLTYSTYSVTNTYRCPSSFQGEIVYVHRRNVGRKGKSTSKYKHCFTTSLCFESGFQNTASKLLLDYTEFFAASHCVKMSYRLIDLPFDENIDTVMILSAPTSPNLAPLWRGRPHGALNRQSAASQ